MYNVFNCSITLGKSKTFLRLSVLIHVVALAVIAYSAWSIGLKLLVVFILILSLTATVLNPCPQTRYTQLRYNKGQWKLSHRKGQEKEYNKLRFLVDTGFFFLLELHQIPERKLLIMFHDQLTETELRILKIYEKIN